MTSFLREHPDYGDAEITALRARDFPMIDRTHAVYLDYTGAALPPASLLTEHCTMMQITVLGNPHSDSPASRQSTKWMETARHEVLKFFGASPKHYDVIWTANATAALRLVGERYAWTRRGCFLYTADSHNSVIGIREDARAAGAEIRYVKLQPDLRINTTDIAVGLTRCQKCSNPGRLFAFPAQCNFSGVQHSVTWIHMAHEMGWDVLVDAAGFVPTNTLDLDVYNPDYVAVSFYKMMGWPTGIGALIARHEALERLTPCLAGGTIWATSVTGDWHIPAPGHEGFEAGTPHYLAFPGIVAGLRYLARVGMESIHTRVTVLTAWTLEALQGLTWHNGAPMVRLYGPNDMYLRGGIIAFNFLHPDGRVVDERIVSRAAARYLISLRTGCFCAPGAGETAFGLDPVQLTTARGTGARLPFDAYLQHLGMESGGAIRISFGLASNAEDAERFVQFASQLPAWCQDAADLPARVHC